MRTITCLDVNVKVYLENNIPAEEVCILNSDTLAKSYVTRLCQCILLLTEGDNACLPPLCHCSRLSSWTYANLFFHFFAISKVL